MLSTSQCATMACLLEAIAPKVGNVHRGADFADMSFRDFAASAVAIGPAIGAAAECGVGNAVLRAIESTRMVTRQNTNLGICLLLAPLAAADGLANGGTIQQGVARVLAKLTPADSRDVYAAVRLASPGGLGTAKKHDLANAAPANLLAAMAEAEEYDLVARQYTTDFAVIFEHVAPWLAQDCRELGLESGIVHVQLRIMNRYPDSLIQRKLGPALAAEAQARAGRALHAGAPSSAEYHEAVADLDFWLRSDGNRRNPGTTADLIAAGLYVGLKTQAIEILPR